MKVYKVVFVAMVVLAVALVSCGDAGGGGIPGIPGEAASASDLPSWGSAEFVKSGYQAYDLLSTAISVLYGDGVLDSLIWDAYPDVEGGDGEEGDIDWDETDMSMDMSTSGKGEVKSVATADIEHSFEASVSSNVAIAKLQGYYKDETYDYFENRKADDYLEGSGSWDATITNLKYEVGDLKIYGTIIVEGSASSTTTLVAKGGADKAADKADPDKKKDTVETVSSSSKKVSIALSISDGTKGAKIIASYARNDDTSAIKGPRAIEAGYAVSDLEVYSKDNELKYTYPLTEKNLNSFANVGNFYDISDIRLDTNN